MPKRLLTIAAIFLLSVSATDLTFDDRLQDHINKIDAFHRKHHGCPAEGYDVSLCSPVRAKTDFALFQKARESAKLLFDLRER